MEIKNFNLKVGDPVIGTGSFGETFGYYRETVSNKSGIQIKFGATKDKSTGVYVRSIDEVRPATEKEIADSKNR